MILTIKKMSILGTALIVLSALVSTIIIGADSGSVSKTVTKFQDSMANAHTQFFFDFTKVVGILSRVTIYAERHICQDPHLGLNETYQEVAEAVVGIDEIVFNNLERLDDLKAKWKKINVGRSSRKLRRVNRKLDTYKKSVLDVLQVIQLSKQFALNNILAFHASATRFQVDSGEDWQQILTPSIIAYDRQRTALHRIEKRSTEVSYITSLISFIVVLLAITLLAFTQLRLADAEYNSREAEAEINAQARLVRQQCHETRSRFGPAVSMMQAFLEASTYEEYQSLRQDMASALSVLKEVEQHQQTRLDVYKILKGNYELHYEIFDLALLLNQRCGAEWTISRLLKETKETDDRHTITSTNNVRFSVGLPTAAYRLGRERNSSRENASVHPSPEAYDCEQGQTPEISVKTDVYILSHLLNNLLSNSRKHTYVGAITVYFLGTHNGKLIFQVRDDGVGIPLEIRDKLFAGADVATADLRGTGLGLSSCQVFARCAEGYVRLVKSELQGATNDHGCTVFEFAVKGEVLENAAAYAYDPNHEQNFIIRDAVHDCTEQDEAITTSTRVSFNRCTSVDSSAAVILSTPPQKVIDTQRKDSYIASTDTTIIDTKETASLSTGAEGSEDKRQQDSLLVPNDIQVLIIDDSGINRSCVRRSINATAVSLKLNGVQFHEYETCEAAQPHLARLAKNPQVIVTIDQSLHSRGGVLTGTDLIKWLTNSLQFQGILISSSGDAFIGQEHVALGAHVAWGKPLPSKKIVQSDIVRCFTEQGKIFRCRRQLNTDSSKMDTPGTIE